MTRPMVGDEIEVITGFGATPLGKWHNQHTPAGRRGFVTSVNTNASTVRFVHRAGETYTVWVEHSNMTILPSDPNAPKPRKLGEVPEGMISPDDPRLDWLWEDAAKLAKQRNYCDQYLVITKTLGIPEAPHPIKVSITVDGLNISKTITARTQAEAQVMLELEVRERLIAGPESL